MQSCLHSHLLECDRCQELRNLFPSLEEEIGKISERCTMAGDDICDLRLLLGDSKDKIEQWKAHILRSVNQEEGKKEVLDKLAPTEAGFWWTIGRLNFCHCTSGKNQPSFVESVV